MKSSKATLGILVLLVTILTTLTSAQASSELITNGSFESGKTLGWTIIGGVMVVRYSHSGHYSLRLGTRLGSGQISQQFQLPSGTSGTISFWYSAVPGDQDATIFATTLLDQNGAIIVQWPGMVDSSWHQIIYTIGSKYDGTKLTLVFFGQPDYTYETVEHQCPRGIICVKIIKIPMYAYVDDVSVTYT